MAYVESLVSLVGLSSERARRRLQPKLDALQPLRGPELSHDGGDALGGLRPDLDGSRSHVIDEPLSLRVRSELRTQLLGAFLVANNDLEGARRPTAGIENEPAHAARRAQGELDVLAGGHVIDAGLAAEGVTRDDREGPRFEQPPDHEASLDIRETPS